MSAGNDRLPRLADVISRYGLRAKRSLGQNFLLDLNLTRRIARAAGELEGCTVYEVGPGPGGLTRALLETGARKVVVIERDERALPALEEIGQAWPGQLEIIAGDALSLDWAQLAAGTKPEQTKIVANLPYNIATALLTGWLTPPDWPPFWSSLTLMFQKEVAERIVGRPGERAYGRLSVISQWRCSVSKMFDVSPKAFTPPPKVTSSVVHFLPLQQPEVSCSVKSLERVTAAAFGQRRKMLRSSLRALDTDTVALIEAAGLDPNLRAEQVDVAGFCRIARLLDNA
jgi:16S rRNA (adenine1518-N6/adenine1519-N6)-dimethyltransferase